MNTPVETSPQLISSPWKDTFVKLAGTADQDLLVVSPFISGWPIKAIMEIVQGKEPPTRPVIHVVTNLAVDSMLSGSVDVAVLLDLVETLPSSTITYLPSLHAKLYVADTKMAVVTSANLTSNGLVRNLEYGVLLRDQLLVTQIRYDIETFAALGSHISRDKLIALSRATQELRSIRRDSEKSVRKALSEAFRQQVDATTVELLQAQAHGKTTHSIFNSTILYLLEKHGPLATSEIHPLVQQIHPDLCDDSVDRVIDDVHFGKKWKHYVRNSQQALKQRGDIGFDGTLWFLTGNRPKVSESG